MSSRLDLFSNPANLATPQPQCQTTSPITQGPKDYEGTGLEKRGKNKSSAYLTFFGLVFGVFREEVGEDIATAGGHVHHRTLLAETKARRDTQHHAHRLHQQGPLAQVAADDETTQDCLDLGNTRACWRRVGKHKTALFASTL